MRQLSKNEQTEINFDERAGKKRDWEKEGQVR